MGSKNFSSFITVFVAVGLCLGLGACPPAKVTVPNCVGRTQSAATASIASAGLISGVTPQFSATVAAGVVISQNPGAGASVAPGSAVSLVVSDGPETALLSLEPASAPPGTPLRLHGRSLPIDPDSTTVHIGDLEVTSFLHGDDGSFIDSVVPLLDPGNYSVTVTEGAFETNAMTLHIEELPATGEPLGAVANRTVQQLAEILQHLSDVEKTIQEQGWSKTLIIPDTSVFVVVQVLIDAYESELAKLSPEELEWYEQFLQTAGVTGALDNLTQLVAAWVEEGQNSDDFFNLFLMSDGLSAALTATNVALTGVQVASLIATLSGPGALPGVPVGTVTTLLKVCVSFLDWTLDARSITDLYEITGPGRIVVTEGGDSSFRPWGNFRTQVPLSVASVALVVDIALTFLPLRLSGQVSKEVVPILEAALLPIGVALGTKYDSHYQTAPTSINMGHYELMNSSMHDALTSMFRGTTYGPLISFMVTHFQPVPPRFGVWVDDPSVASATLEDGTVVITGLDAGRETTLNLAGCVFRTLEEPILAGLTFGAEFPLNPGERDSQVPVTRIPIQVMANEPPNYAPDVYIHNPENGDMFVQGDLILFTGEAEDPEDGVLSGSALEWTSSIDGTIGYDDYTATAFLSVGAHDIRLTATDGDGETASRTVRITVTEEPASVLAVDTYTVAIAPDQPEAVVTLTNAGGELLRWSATATDPRITITPDSAVGNHTEVSLSSTCFTEDILALVVFRNSDSPLDTEVVELAVDSSPQVTWAKTFGGSDDDVAYAVQQTSDGGYVLAGYTGGYFGGGNTDMYLVKTDANGNQQWTQTFGGSTGDKAEAVEQTSDGGYVLAGWTINFGTGYDMYLVKTNANGNRQWDQTYGGSSNDVATAMQQTSDGGYILAGITYYTHPTHDGDMYLVKTDASGNEQWDRTFVGFDTAGAYDVQQTSDGGYIIVGFTGSFGTGYSYMYLVKADANGNQQWDRTFGGGVVDYASAVQQTSDGGYIIAGSAFVGISGYANLVKTDGNGNLQWTQSVDLPSDGAYAVTAAQQTCDGRYVLVARAVLVGSGEGWSMGNMYLVKTDAYGSHQWDRTFGGILYDGAFAVEQTSDGGYIIAGETDSFGAGLRDMYLVKTDSSGNAPSVPSK